MPLHSVLLEFSEDPLSDASPAWADVTSDLRSIEWWAGIDREGDEPKPGGATIHLKNTNRRWEPEFGSNTITTGRRFRLTLNDGGGSTQEGLWYVTDIAIDYPASTGYSEVTMSCSDGCEVLALDALPLMDPPDADSYADVVAFDEPWGYWRLGEPAGTRARPNIIRVTRTVRRGGESRRRKFRVRRGTRYFSGEAGSVAGPAGIYKNNPLLGLRSLILGDTSTSAEFRELNGNVQHMRVPVEDVDQFSDNNAVSLEVWNQAAATPASNRVFMAGPFNTTAGTNTFYFTVTTGVLAMFTVALTTGNVTVTSTLDIGIDSHIVGTWDGTWVRLYLNGVLEAEAGASGNLRDGNANEFVYVGTGESPLESANITLDEPAVYEYALSAERVLAHYQAGAERGWPEQTAGERIADIATHALWSEANIQTTGRDVQPQFKHGQAKLDEISELAHAEGPRTMFFFNGSGDPVYLGHEWQATAASYNTVQVTLGDTPSEVGYEALELVYDNETYNEVTASHESGEAATAADTTAQGERGRRANTEYTDVLLMEHNHVESLANAVLAFYKDPALRPVTVTLNGANATRLTHILDRDIGHLIRVKKSGETGARIDRVANIIGKRKVLTADKLLTCQWTLSRGFNANAGLWQAGVTGFSEAGSTTVAA